MNLDDLMDVWRAQDASPLVDKTLLHLALRQEQVKLQKQRRRGRWFMYGLSALVLVFMGFFLAVMISPQGGDAPSVWAYAIPVLGVAVALVMAGAVLVDQRAQAAREQGFGDSLRDQLRRHIAQLEDSATRSIRQAIFIVGSGTVSGILIAIAGWGINDFPHYGDLLPKGVVWMGLSCFFVMWLHRVGQRQIVPRKRELEALLKELDRQ